MRIAIVGSGISGLTAAWLLNKHHKVTLFEANDYLGGHTNTVDIELDEKLLQVDTGFIVFNDWTYPNFIQLLKTLNVESTETSMGFSVRCDRTNLEYCGSDLNALFAQRSNLLRPNFYRLLRDILRFNKLAPKHLEGPAEESVGEFLKNHGFSRIFADKYLLPMGAAIWSCPMKTFEQFPIRFIIEFYINHGLLLLKGRPVWRTITGGSRNYINKMKGSLGDVRLNSPISKIQRFDDRVVLEHPNGLDEFDELILATHSNTSLNMLSDADGLESELLREFPYSKNVAVLHTDKNVLPKRRNAWASWNYHIRDNKDSRPSVTYNMNILQQLQTDHTVNVTLNEENSIQEDKILRTFQYSHPVFTTKRKAVQLRHGELIRRRRTSYCGAYWGNGFHEDGVNSALAVCRQFNVAPPWDTGD